MMGSEIAVFHAVWDSVADAMALSDPQGILLSVNQAYLDFFDVTREEVIGREFTMVFAEDFREEARARYKSLFDGPKTFSTSEGTIKRRDGSVREIESRISFLIENGEHTAMLSIVRDITGHKTVQHASAHLAAIVESSEDAIIGKTLEGIIVSWNAGAQRIYGYTPEEAIGQPISILIPPDHPDELPRIMKRIKRGERVAHYETVRVRKDGTRLDISLTVSPIRDDAGVITGASAVARDITESKELDRRKNEFLSLASHELKTPVTVIKGFSQYALKFATGTENRKLLLALKGIDENTNHIARLISDLLDVSRIERAFLPIYPVEFDLLLLVQEVIEGVELTTPDLVYTFESPDEPVVVVADSQLIRQVVNNLVENAIKYSRDVPRVEVRVTVSEGEVITSIRDFGIGIPEEEQARVFERFYRARNAGHRSRNGLGLGLFITQGIVARHGGTIWLESVEEAGTTFYFSLPLGRGNEM
jgi:PAS domain S-box-containing protein